MEVVDPTRPQRAAVAAVAATLLVIGLTAAGAPAPDPSATTPAVADAVHEPRVTASGTAIPLPRDSAVVVVDVAGVEHARLLASSSRRGRARWCRGP